MSRIGDRVRIKHTHPPQSQLAIDSDTQKHDTTTILLNFRVCYSRDQACALSCELVDSGVDGNNIGIRSLSIFARWSQRRVCIFRRAASKGPGTLLSLFRTARTHTNSKGANLAGQGCGIWAFFRGKADIRKTSELAVGSFGREVWVFALMGMGGETTEALKLGD